MLSSGIFNNGEIIDTTGPRPVRFDHRPLVGLLAPYCDSLVREYFVAAGFDERGHLVSFAECAGSATRVDAIILATRAVLGSPKTASIVIAHSHITGDAKPSDADLQATRQIEKLSRMAGTRLLDHLIFAPSDIFSFAEHGMI